MAIEIFRGVERIVSFRHIKCENRCVKPGLIPMAEFHRFSELLAVNADLQGSRPLESILDLPNLFTAAL